MSNGLPDTATMKMLELRGMADEAQIAMNATQQRLTDLDKTAGGRGTPADDPVYVAERSRLIKQRTRQSERHRELANLIANIDTFLRGQRHVTFEPARVRLVKLQDETAKDAVTRMRNEIEQAKANLIEAQRAPLPRSEIIARARKHVDALAEKGRPHVHFDQKTGEFTVAIPPERGSGGPSITPVFGVLAWLDPDRMFQRIKAEIEAKPEPEYTLTVEEKRTRVASIKAVIDTLERDEETLIVRAAAEGIEILRRPNAHPAAVLGITISRKAMAA